MQEVSFTIDWGVWFPIILSAIALVFSVFQMRKRSEREDLNSLENKIDRAHSALRECSEELKHRGRENDALRREKFALLEQIARISNPTSQAAEDDSDSGGAA